MLKTLFEEAKERKAKKQAEKDKAAATAKWEKNQIHTSTSKAINWLSLILEDLIESEAIEI